MTRAIVAGALASKPRNGGAAWTRMSWAVGLRELGFDVHFVEELGVGTSSRDVDWAKGVLDGFAIEGTLLDHEGGTVSGLARPDLEDLVSGAALLVNISGHLRDPGLRDRAQLRVYVDLDPGYTQLWHEQGLLGLAGHDHYRTVGLAIGSPSCRLPTGGLRWRGITQPVLLREWPRRPATDRELFTTVASWRGPYGTVEHEGRVLGPKAHQLRRFLALPRSAPGSFELALDIHPADDGDRAALERSGWRLRDPLDVAADPGAFRDYVTASTAEWSVAQGMYVETGCGWFSDRTTRYLATGRPALVQDTGYGAHLPLGEGLLSFDDLDGAVEGATRILGDYEHHATAARQLAEEHFASDVVLGRLCEEVGVAP